MKSKLITALTITAQILLSSLTAGATQIDIRVAYDVSLEGGQYDTNFNNTGHPYLWVGDNSYLRNNSEAMFGFDMTPLTSQLSADDTLSIDQITFNAWNNYNSFEGYDGFVSIALGYTDDWDPDLVTWNTSFGDHGDALDAVWQSDDNLNSQVSWDVSAVGSEAFTDDNFLTFYLFTTPLNEMNWHDYEAEEWTDSHEAFLTVDYTINSRTVPEPATFFLSGAGLLTLMAACKIRQSMAESRSAKHRNATTDAGQLIASHH